MSEAGICRIKPEFVVADPTRALVLACVSDKDRRALADAPPGKRPRLSKGEKRRLRGQNKARGPTVRADRALELCNSLVDVPEGAAAPPCARAACPYLHDVRAYLAGKPADLAPACPNFAALGRCARGAACRFGGAHLTPEGRNRARPGAEARPARNQLRHEVQAALRKRTYDFGLAEALIRHTDGQPAGCGAVTDEDVVRLLAREKRAIDWRGKLVLSPLTTVGNLPFRRVCKEYGADVTCGEMAMCAALLQGMPQEWALVKRHHTEDVFGVQLCANNPYLLTKTGQVLEAETEIDFIDLNLGCPIEMVYKEGGGCGLLRRNRALESCVRNLSSVLTIPMTVKTRTGVYTDDNIAHRLAPKFRDWGASMLTVHGRSKEQRYAKSADWPYIRQVAQAAAPLPVFGNGDIFSYSDYKRALEECPELTGVTIGRGALIKPWLFEEIKEQKLWDISSGERFEILKRYTNYGLEHWGSDNKGVENTRRFMLEWLSFLHRYVPVGLLEAPPQRINERPPSFIGRDELETLFASTSAADWIKISEMLLGKVPEGFHFLPKHKASSYK